MNTGSTCLPLSRKVVEVSGPKVVWGELEEFIELAFLLTLLVEKLLNL